MTDIKPLHILVAEDTHAHQLMMQALLGKIGHSCEVVATGADALDRRIKGQFDLILMDISMPVMDGTEATDAIRRAETVLNLPRIPIIAVTAHALEGGREYFQGYDMDGYVIKPVQVIDLLAEITRVLEAPPAE